MSFRISLRPEVAADISDAADWYESKRPGLGGEFAEAIFQAVDGLALNPFLTSRRHRSRDIRFAYPIRFPYRIVYEVTEKLS
jgi:hypothetical protein